MTVNKWWSGLISVFSVDRGIFLSLSFLPRGVGEVKGNNLKELQRTLISLSLPLRKHRGTEKDGERMLHVSPIPH